MHLRISISERGYLPATEQQTSENISNYGRGLTAAAGQIRVGVGKEERGFARASSTEKRGLNNKGSNSSLTVLALEIVAH